MKKYSDIHFFKASFYGCLRVGFYMFRWLHMMALRAALLPVVFTPSVVLTASELRRHPEPLLFSDWGSHENVKIRDTFLQHLGTPESIVPSPAAKAVSLKILQHNMGF